MCIRDSHWALLQPSKTIDTYIQRSLRVSSSARRLCRHWELLKYVVTSFQRAVINAVTEVFPEVGFTVSMEAVVRRLQQRSVSDDESNYPATSYVAANDNGVADIQSVNQFTCISLHTKGIQFTKP